MAKLDLDVAQLTDIGRKRPHNEDNMAYVIPKDQQVMANKGALFIVADGMGGHAAGEVASEIAVDTVSNVYYQDDSEDVTSSLLHAIRRANGAIHQRASENLMRTGMGTTCVAAVLRGNMAYIANVGDSRAYLVHKGQIKQISQDHSWVAEQVRAGLLTEDQARTHAQRNVITRSLGTQAEVDIDIFCEQLQAGDSLVLCTDGLSGLVSDDELRQIVEQFLPQESVYHLVERANEAGGPDNITAIVVRVNEVGAELPNGRKPVHVGGREEGEDTATLGLLPGSAVSYAARNGEGRNPSAPLHLSSEPLATSESTAPPLVIPAESHRQRSRLFYPTLILLSLLVISIAGGGIYYYLRVNESQVVQQALDFADRQISLANGQVASNQATALSALSSAQKRLRELQKNHQLNASQSSRVNSLQDKLTALVNTAIVNYDQTAKIKILPCDQTVPGMLNTGSTNTFAQSIAAVQGPKNTFVLYALGHDGNLYHLNQNATQYTLVSALPPLKGVQLTSIAANGSQLLALTRQSSTPPGYTLNVFTTDPGGKLSKPTTVELSVTLAKEGWVPGWIAAWKSTIYVILSSPANPQSAYILTYSSDAKGHPSSMPQQTSISVSYNIVSVAAFPDHLFLLLADGQVQSIQLGGKNAAPISVPIPVQVQQTIATPLAISDQGFSAGVDVPTVTQNTSTFLIIPDASLLAVGQINGMPHLYVVDPVNHRLLDLNQITTQAVGVPLTPTATAVSGAATPGTGSEKNTTLQLNQQYVSSALLSQIKGLAVDPSGMNIYALVQNSTSTWALVSATTTPQTGCKV